MPSIKSTLIKEIKMLLGEPNVRVELTNEQVELGINKALQYYNQRSSNSVEEAFLYLHLDEDKSLYTLPNNVMEVRKIYRRGNGTVAGSGSTVDPFSLSYSNTYLLSAVRGSTGGGLLTYDLWHQFDETVARLFGRDIIFTWNSVTKEIKLHRDVRGPEDVLLHVYHNKPEEVILSDYQAQPWIRDWGLAEAKIMLGRTRGKMSSIIGPQGGVTLDGPQLIEEGNREKEDLMDQMSKYTNGNSPIGFFFG